MSLNGLDSDKHRDWKLHRTQSYQHMASYHSVAIGNWEMGKVAMSYPVVFECVETGYRPVALLSLVQQENQYLIGDNWRVAYVPAAVRVYPFRLLEDRVLIDEAAPHFKPSEQGESLFTEAGEPTPVLQEAMSILHKCQQEESLTRQWCKRMAELELFTELTIEIVSPQGVHYRLVGFHGVDAKKLGALSDTQLATLARDGSLALIHMQQMSLDHLLVLAAQRDTLQAPDTTNICETVGVKAEAEEQTITH